MKNIFILLSLSIMVMCQASCMNDPVTQEIIRLANANPHNPENQEQNQIINNLLRLEILKQKKFLELEKEKSHQFQTQHAQPPAQRRTPYPQTQRKQSTFRCKNNNHCPPFKSLSEAKVHAQTCNPVCPDCYKIFAITSNDAESARMERRKHIKNDHTCTMCKKYFTHIQDCIDHKHRCGRAPLSPLLNK